MNAIPVEGLKDFVGNSKYGIFFPSKGPRSMADEIAGGDYDGDMYWVSTNTEVFVEFLNFSCLRHILKTDSLMNDAYQTSCS